MYAVHKILSIFAAALFLELKTDVCCCTDGTKASRGDEWNDHRTARENGDGICGYNRFTKLNKEGETIHEICIRLRNPSDYDKFWPCGEIDSTIAHELAHCGHQDHGLAFYLLMGEIQQEHYQLLDSGEVHQQNESTEEQFGYDIYKTSVNGATAKT